MMFKWFRELFNCRQISNKYFGRKTPEILPRKKTSLPAMERRLQAARNIVDGSLMDKE
tara:strand:- start:117 stop:290 length:174 start_codon:yes stop_codon:yes gene_type:complete